MKRISPQVQLLFAQQGRSCYLDETHQPASTHLFSQQGRICYLDEMQQLLHETSHLMQTLCRIVDSKVSLFTDIAMDATQVPLVEGSALRIQRLGTERRAVQ